MRKTKLQFTPKRITEVWGYGEYGCVEISRKGGVHRLGPTASRIWERCDGRTALGEMACDPALAEAWQRNGLIILDYNSLHSASEYDDSAVYPIKANVNHPVDILLLAPPSPSPYAHRDVRLEPLGNGYMSSLLKSRGFAVGLMDLWVSPLNPPTIKDFIARYNPKIVGISAKTVNFENGVKIAGIIANELDESEQT